MTHSRSRVLLDVDGVLANFHEATYDLVVELGGPQYTSEDMKGWNMLDVIKPKYHEPLHERWRAEGFCAGLEAYPETIDGVRKLQEVADVFFVTAPFYDAPFWMWERLNWLKAKFKADDYQVVFVHDKRIVRGNMLVEDRPKNIIAWADAHPESLVAIWDQPYTRFFKEPTNSFRTMSWDVLVELVGSWRPPPA